MSTTNSLNSNDSFYVTTYYGDDMRGRCYDFTMHRDGKKVSLTLSEAEVFRWLQNSALSHLEEDDGVLPVFDNKIGHHKPQVCPSCGGLPPYPGLMVVRHPTIANPPVFDNCTNPIHNAAR